MITLIRDDVRAVLMNLPCTVRGYTTLNDDGSYTVVVNARLSAERQKATIEHEINHITSDDFLVSDDMVDELEYERHFKP